MQVRAALEAEGEEALDVSLVAFEAGLSMEWVSDLCCTPLFYHRCGAPPYSCFSAATLGDHVLEMSGNSRQGI